jgi:nitroreductase
MFSFSCLVIVVLVVILAAQEIMAFSATSSTTLVKSLHWRQALKRFQKVSPDSVNIQPVLEAIRLSPSGNGVQPYNIHVVKSPEMKVKLRAASYNQAQVCHFSPSLESLLMS